MKKCNQRDIIVYWIDALGFGEEANMSYLNGRIKESRSFSNVYTVTPYVVRCVEVLRSMEKEVISEVI